MSSMAWLRLAWGLLLWGARASQVFADIQSWEQLSSAVLVAANNSIITIPFGQALVASSTIVLDRPINVVAGQSGIGLDPGVTVQCSSDLQGPAFEITSHSVVLQGLALSQCGASAIVVAWGAASNPLASWDTNAVRLQNLSLYNNYKPWGNGSAIVIVGAAVSLESCTLQGNRAKQGGAITMTGGWLRMVNSTFTNNTALKSGGVAAVYQGRAVQALNSTFIDNKVVPMEPGLDAVNGGAIAVWDTPDVEVQGCRFQDNGALDPTNVCAAAQELEPRGCGGAVFAAGFGVALRVNSSTFEGNGARVGGALALYNGTLQVDACTFVNNSAVASGGSVDVDSSTLVNITNTLFARCNVSHHGGAVSAVRVTEFVLQDSLLVNNTAQVFAAGLYLDGADNALLSRSNLTGNLVNLTYGNMGDVYGSYGAAVCVIPALSGNVSNIVMDRCRLFDNAVRFWMMGDQPGGRAAGIHVRGVNATALVRNSHMGNNSAFSGSSIWFHRGVIAAIVNSTFSNDKAGNFGSVRLSTGFVTMDSVIFANNSCLNGGAALRLADGGIFDVRNCTFRNNTSQYGAGALRVEKGVVGNFTDCLFEDNRSLTGTAGVMDSLSTFAVRGTRLVFRRNTAGGGGGGAIAFLNVLVLSELAQVPTMQLEDCVFDDNQALVSVVRWADYPDTVGWGGGGDIALSGVFNMSCVRCNFTGSQADTEGGSVWAAGNVTLLLEDCRFTSSKSHRSGGAIAAGAGANITLRNTLVTASQSVQHGGAIFFTSTPGAPVRHELENVVIVNCSAGRNGGALAVSGASATAVRVVVDGSESGGDGGAVAVELYGLLSMSDSIINGSSAAKGRGGAVFLAQSVMQLSNVTLMDARAYSGGVLSAVASSLDALDLTVAGGRAAMAGGLLMQQQSNISLVRTKLNGNSAEDNGGALYVSQSRLMLDKSTCVSNTASSGGCLYCTGTISTVTIKGSNLNGNRALSGRGGAVSQVGAPLTLLNTLLENNSAVTMGGALALDSVPNATLQGVRLHANQALEGGALSATRSALDVADCDFSGNTALAAEKALATAVAADAGADQVVAGGGGNGGALAMGVHTSLTMSRSSLANNTAVMGGALHGRSDTVLDVRQCNLTSNQAYLGGAVAAMGNCTFKLRSCRLDGNAAMSHGGAMYTTTQTAVASSAPEDSSTPAQPDMRLWLSLAGCGLANNTATQGAGGALVVQGGVALTLSQTSFINNLAGTGGGAVQGWAGPMVVLEGVELRGNQAAGGRGGGMSCTACYSVTASNTSVTSNSALYSGGGFAIVNATRLDLDGVRLVGNRAGEAWGPANASSIAKTALAAVKKEGVSTRRCSSNLPFGGGLCVQMGCLGSSMSSNLNISSNSAFSGGGMLVDVCSGGSRAWGTALNISVMGLLIHNNSALISGGGFFTGSLALPDDDGLEVDARGGTCSRQLCVAGNSVSDVPGSFGAQVAGDATSVAFSQERLTLASRQVTGLSASLLDVHGQVVASGPSSGLAITLHVPDSGIRNRSGSPVELSGATLALAQAGIVNFSALTVSAAPGSSFTLQVSALTAQGVAPANVTVDVYPCVCGEVQLNDSCAACLTPNYAFASNLTQCQACPPFAGTCNGSVLTPLSGLWQSHPRSPQLHACPLPLACVRNTAQQQALAATQLSFQQLATPDISDQQVQGYLQQQCAEGYTGTLCRLCSEGSVDYMLLSATCMQCPAPSALPALLLLLFLAVSTVIGLFLWLTIAASRVQWERLQLIQGLAQSPADTATAMLPSGGKMVVAEGGGVSDSRLAMLGSRTPADDVQLPGDQQGRNVEGEAATAVAEAHVCRVCMTATSGAGDAGACCMCPEPQYASTVREQPGGEVEVPQWLGWQEEGRWRKSSGVRQESTSSQVDGSEASKWDGASGTGGREGRGGDDGGSVGYDGSDVPPNSLRVLILLMMMFEWMQQTELVGSARMRALLPPAANIASLALSCSLPQISRALWACAKGDAAQSHPLWYTAQISLLQLIIIGAALLVVYICLAMQRRWLLRRTTGAAASPAPLPPSAPLPSCLHVLLWLFYPSLSYNAMRVLACAQVDQQPDTALGEASTAYPGPFWTQDYNLQCWAGTHKAMAFGLAVPVIALVTLGYPLALAAALWAAQRRKALQDPRLALRAAPLYAPYVARRWWWGAASFMARGALAAVAVFVEGSNAVELYALALATQLLLLVQLLASPVSCYQAGAYAKTLGVLAAAAVSGVAYVQLALLTADPTGPVVPLLASAIVLLQAAVLTAFVVTVLLTAHSSWARRAPPAPSAAGPPAALDSAAPAGGGDVSGHCVRCGWWCVGPTPTRRWLGCRCGRRLL